MKHNMLKVLLLALCLTLCLGVALAEEKGDLWLTDEKVTLTLWYDFTQEQLGNMADPNEADVFKWLEEQTNVHIEWLIPVSGTEKESFNLLFAGERMPDILRTRNKYQYTEGAEAAVEDGYYLRLNELLEENAPNYMAMVNGDASIKKEVTTDSGLMWGMYFVYSGNGKACNYGPAIRMDMLEKVGLDVPVTYEDWHTVLTAFKKQLGVEAPLFINSRASSTHDDWMSGFGVNQKFFQVDGAVKYGPIEAGYGEYIEQMKKWYDEGLIYTDFALASGDTPDETLILNDRVGAWAGFASNCGSAYYRTRGAVNEDFMLMGTTFPVKEAGETTHLRFADTFVNEYAFAVSTDCEYPEIAVKWLDIFYNLAYNDNFNYGLREGETWVLDENGEKIWGDMINHNEDGLTVTQARVKFTMLNAPIEDYTRVMGSWSQEQLASQQAWLKGSDDWCLPDKLSPSSDESREISATMADIETFVKEETVKMILGTSNYTFETFCEQIRSMGIDDVIASYQTILDRYNAR